MISYYVLEKYDFIEKCWFKIREFSCDDLQVAKGYLKIFRSKETDRRFRLVGVVSE